MERRFLRIKQLTEYCKEKYYSSALEFDETEDAEQRLLQIYEFLLDEV